MSKSAIKKLQLSWFQSTLLLGTTLILVISFLFSSEVFIKGVGFGRDPNTVVLTTKGFNPPRLIVKVGEQVTFKSVVNRDFWPASDIHPKHLFYGEFDPKKAIGPNESWSFTFERPGSWTYHDHLSPEFKARIDVLDGSSLADLYNPKRYIEKCRSILEGSSARRCWEEFLGILTEREGPKSAFVAYERLRNEEELIATSCHDFAHLIGEYFYWRFARTGTFEEMQEADTCSFGFYHGFMREYGHHGRDFVEGAMNLCNSLKGRGGEDRSWRISHCLHGAGHGLIYYYAENDGLTSELELINRGIEDCKYMTQDELARRECVNGAFLGLYNMYTKSHVYELDMRAGDPFWYCDRLIDPKYMFDCYDQLAPASMLYTNGDLVAAIKLYTQQYSPPGDSLPAIMTHLGYVASNGHYAINQNYSKAEDFFPVVPHCRKAGLPDDLEAYCVKGIVQSIITRSIPSTALAEAVRFCQSDILVNAGEKRECYGMIMFHGTGFLDNPEDRIQDKKDPGPFVKQVCSMVKEEERQHCYQYSMSYDGRI